MHHIHKPAIHQHSTAPLLDKLTFTISPPRGPDPRKWQALRRLRDLLIASGTLDPPVVGRSASGRSVSSSRIRTGHREGESAYLKFHPTWRAREEGGDPHWWIELDLNGVRLLIRELSSHDRAAASLLTLRDLGQEVPNYLSGRMRETARAEGGSQTFKVQCRLVAQALERWREFLLPYLMNAWRSVQSEEKFLTFASESADAIPLEVNLDWKLRRVEFSEDLPAPRNQTSLLDAIRIGLERVVGSVFTSKRLLRKRLPHWKAQLRKGVQMITYPKGVPLGELPGLVRIEVRLSAAGLRRHLPFSTCPRGILSLNTPETLTGPRRSKWRPRRPKLLPVVDSSNIAGSLSQILFRLRVRAKSHLDAVVAATPEHGLGPPPRWDGAKIREMCGLQEKEVRQAKRILNRLWRKACPVSNWYEAGHRVLPKLLTNGLIVISNRGMRALAFPPVVPVRPLSSA